MREDHSGIASKTTKEAVNTIIALDPVSQAQNILVGSLKFLLISKIHSKYIFLIVLLYLPSLQLIDRYQVPMSGKPLVSVHNIGSVISDTDCIDKY